MEGSITWKLIICWIWSSNRFLCISFWFIWSRTAIVKNNLLHIIVRLSGAEWHQITRQNFEIQTVWKLWNHEHVQCTLRSFPYGMTSALDCINRQDKNPRQVSTLPIWSGYDWRARALHVYLPWNQNTNLLAEAVTQLNRKPTICHQKFVRNIYKGIENNKLFLSAKWTRICYEWLPSRYRKSVVGSGLLFGC